MTNKEKYNYLVFFDLDRTITKAISGRVLARRAVKKGFMNGKDIAAAIYYGLTYRLGFADTVRIMEKMTGWVKGLPEDALTDLCSEVVYKDLLPSIHPDVYEEIRMHRSRNGRIIILSTTLAPICRMIADHLELDDLICSKLEVRNGFLTGSPDGNLCYGDEKRLRIKDYCERNHSSPDESWYYADAIVDLPALSFVGFPVCINPDRKLKKKATERGWRIYYW